MIIQENIMVLAKNDIGVEGLVNTRVKADTKI